MKKFFKGLILVILLALVGLCIAYVCQPSLFDGWFGIAEEETVEPEQPGEDVEEPDDDTEDTGETEAYICNVSDYEFDGNTITAYNGDDKYIQIPSSYSISGTEMVKMTFDEMEFQEYLMMNFEDITYPITITDANSEQYTLNSEMDVFENQDIVYPVSLEVEKPIFVEGNDYQVTSVGGFGNSNIISVKIPEGVIEIGGFSSCNNLKSIQIPSSVTTIGYYAFKNCSNLKSITLSDNITKIYPFAFNSSGLESINIPGSIEVFEENLFSECSNLKEVTIGKGVKSIGFKTFYDCDSLLSITIPDSVNEIKDFAFAGCDLLETFNVDPNNTTFYSEGNAIIEKSTKTLVIGCNNTIIPIDVTAIGGRAFSYLNIDTIQLPLSIVSIGFQAFYSSNITQIIIPKNVVNLGYDVFQNCVNLECIFFESENPAIIDTTWKHFIPETTIIYVPDAAVETYKTAEGFIDYVDQIKPLSEYQDV